MGQRAVAELEAAWKRKQPDGARKRLLVLRLVVRHGQIAEVVGVSRPTVFNYLDLFQSGGVKALLQRQYRGGKKATLDEGAARAIGGRASHRRVSPDQGNPAVGTPEDGPGTGAAHDLLLAGKSRRSLENAAQDSHAKGRGPS